MLLEVPWILRRYENQIGIIGACTSFKLLARQQRQQRTRSGWEHRSD